MGVAESGPFAGRRVVGEINCACWTCETCRRGLPTHCPNRTVLGILNHDGAFADVIAVPQRNLHAVPDTLSDDVAVFTEPVAAAFQIPVQITIGKTDRIAVLGDGRLGNLCAQVLARLSDRVLVIGKHRRNLAILAAMGIATTLLSDSPGERSQDIVVDCTGSESGLPAALQLVTPSRHHRPQDDGRWCADAGMGTVCHRQIALVGSRCGPFDQALAALERGEVQVQPLISDRFDLSRGLDALARAQTKGILKVLLRRELTSTAGLKTRRYCCVVAPASLLMSTAVLPRASSEGVRPCLFFTSNRAPWLARNSMMPSEPRAAA